MSHQFPQSRNNTWTGTNTFSGVATFSSGVILAYVAKTANYTITTSDYTIDCTSGTFTVTLPTAVGIAGQVFNIINSGSGVITLATTSSQTIGNGTYATGLPFNATTQTINPGEVLNVQSTNAHWRLVA
jgi:hypothetical protein